MKVSGRYDCVICAKGNSKGIPGKNLRKLGLKTLIELCIEKARSCKYVNKIIVTSEHDKIIELARAAGADIVIKRSVSLSSDRIRQVEVVRSLVKDLDDQRITLTRNCILLQTTTPFIITEDIEAAVEMHQSNKAAQILSVHNSDISPTDLYFSNRGCLHKLYSSTVNSNQRQLQPKLLQSNGGIRLFNLQHLIEKGDFFNQETDVLGVEIPKNRSLNLDEMSDWYLALERIKEVD